MSDIVQQLGWIDLSAMIIMVVFLVLGLFRGLIWQLTRFLTIIAGYILAGIYAGELSRQLTRVWAQLDSSVALLISYFIIFLTVAILLSAIAWLLTGLLKKLKMGAYDRIGGGLMGMATGAGIIVIVLAGLYALSGSQEVSIIRAAEKSRTKATAVTVLHFLHRDLKCTFLGPVVKVLDNNHQPAPVPTPAPATTAPDGGAGAKPAGK